MRRKTTIRIFYITNSFNPRTRKGCDFFLFIDASFHFSFNPRTRKGCDRRYRPRTIMRPRFNPRTRKGCDHDHTEATHHEYDVSIHAPVKDATGYRPERSDARNVSIHAPVKDATAPLSGPVNRAFQRHFARTSFFSPENKGGFPNIFYFTCIFNRLAMRATHGGKSVHLGCPHRQTG